MGAVKTAGRGREVDVSVGGKVSIFVLFVCRVSMCRRLPPEGDRTLTVGREAMIILQVLRPTTVCPFEARIKFAMNDSSKPPVNMAKQLVSHSPNWDSPTT